jgi:Outer membrane protein beta-barrel domain
MRRAWLVLVLTLCPAYAPAGGAKNSKAPPGQQKRTPRGPDVFGAYSYTHAGEAGLNGWQLTATFPFRGGFRWEADLSGHYGSFAGADLSQLTFLAGARYVLSRPRVSPFGHVLLGGARRTASVPGASLSSSDTDWGGGLGGGVEGRIDRRWAVRAQADLLVLHGLGQWDIDPRLSLGAVYRFGR